MRRTLQDIVNHTLFKVLLGIFTLVLIGAVMVSFFESSVNQGFYTLGDAIWWALVTMTTVGYGDRVPMTTGGRIIGIMIMFFGIALVSIFTATVSSIFIARKIKEDRGLENINFKDHLIICGWNFNGEQILIHLQKSAINLPVVLINQLSEDAVADIINQFSQLNIKFVRGDFTKEPILVRANLKLAKSVIILPDTSTGLSSNSDERTILATLSIKSINNKIKVYAHILDRENLSHLKKAKVDEVLVSDSYAGYLLSSHILAPGVPQLVEQLFGDEASYHFQRLTASGSMHGKSYGELKNELEADQNTICLGIGKETEAVNIMDILSDDYSFLDKFIKRKFEEAGRGFSDKNKINIRINPPPNTIIDPKDFFIIIRAKG